MVLVGLLCVGLYDARTDSPTYGVFEVQNLGASNSGRPNMIRIPPLVWHSLEWGDGGGTFLNAKFPAYNQSQPDKYRVGQHDLPDVIRW